MVALLVLLALRDTPPPPPMLGATQTSFREIASITGNVVQVAEDGSALQTLGNDTSPMGSESVLNVASGKLTTAPSCSLLLDSSHLVCRHQDHGETPRFAATLWKLEGKIFEPAVTIPETLPHLHPFIGSNWPTPGGLTAILVSGAANNLYKATYTWRTSAVKYRQIGRLPTTFNGLPINNAEVDPTGSRAILNTSGGNALWTKGEKLDYLGSKPARFWLGQVMAFTRGRIEAYGSDKVWRTAYTGWTVLGTNSTGEWIVFRREQNHRCFIAHYRRGIVHRRPGGGDRRGRASMLAPQWMT